MSSPSPYDNIAPTGSNLYYSVIFTEENQKNAILALHTFYHELESLLDKCNTPDIALQRFQWWRGECHRMFLGTPEHPVGKALTPIIEQYHLPKSIFVGLIDGIERKLSHSIYENWLELIEDAHRSSSLLAILIAHVLGDTSQAALFLARDLGVCWQVTRNLKRLPWDLKKQRIFLPKDLLKETQLSEKTMLHFFDDRMPQDEVKKLHTLAKKLLSKTKNQYKNAAKNASTVIKQKQSSSLILTTLELSTVARLETRRITRNCYPLDISPLKKWWISTRIFNRFQKG